MAGYIPLGPEKALNVVKKGLDKTADSVVPWFYQNMPDYYFRTHSRADQVQHLQAIISGQVTTDNHTITLVSPCKTRITYISPGGSEDELISILDGHLGDKIETARLYISADGQMRLNTILLGGQPRADRETPEFKAAMESVDAEGMLDKAELDNFARFLTGANQDYVEKFDPIRAERHFKMSRELGESEDSHVWLEQCNPNKETRIVVGMRNPPSTGLLLQIMKIFHREGITLNRAYGDSFVTQSGHEMAILSFYVTYRNDLVLPDSELWHSIKKKLKLVKWFAPHALEAYADNEGWSLKRVMLLQAACEFAHVFLIRQNLWAYTSDNIVDVALERKDEIAKLIEYFETRFDPTRTNREADMARLESEINDLLSHMVEENERMILKTMLRFFRHTMRTNYYLEDIYGLAFRLDPVFLKKYDPRAGVEEEMPYGIFFFHGPYCQGFHIRYRDMARGGVRIVPTRSQEQFELESNRLYDEVKALAYAQHYKNKDIPEGGSKAVMLLGPRGDVRLAVMCFMNSLLDVMLSGADTPALPGVVDYLAKEEIIYLGPDENIAPEHIVWGINRARERGYRWPSAFMSSKPGAGINHKEYGVTSLGLMVFAEEMLKAMGIDPKTQPFTVKLTGGPKGDVAGNALHIMFRDYGENARIVCMTDGHGAAYDPEGLDHRELKRLIKEQRSIDAFNAQKLKGKGAYVVSANTPEGVRLRNTLHNTAIADIFIPCGGRPDTINMKNWRDFFTESGEPSAKAIVEGANLFLSPDAREEIALKGVLTVHGSSANKTGVICSSYEILGGLVMTESEFIDIKQTYVEQVLEILAKRARDEARLLLRERRKCDSCKPLHAISIELSSEINKVSDLLYNTLMEDTPNIEDDAALCELLLMYCPPVLVEKYRDRIITRVPQRHQYALISAFVASRIVYAEGMDWLNTLVGLRDVRQITRTYLEEEKKVASYVAELKRSRISDKNDIIHILEATGRKRMTFERLGLE